ncbi:MAG: Hsp70 family protein [Treponema sp.]|nr:Hsp70 family protein [Treponema sp.]
MASTIGIKIANGEFYPLVEENSLVKKKLILTTVHDNQPSVQIDLFRSPVSNMADAQYIGTVVVENIKPKPKSEPSIEMVISSDENGNIIADAIDLDPDSHSEHYVLTVSLKSMDESTRDVDIPDFELEPDGETPSGLYQHAEKIRQRKKTSSKSWVFILIGIILVLGLLAAWLFFFGGLDTVRSLYTRFTSTQTVQSEPALVPIRQLDPIIDPAAKQLAPVIDPATLPPLFIEPVKQTEPVQQTVVPPPVIQAPSAAPAQSQTQAVSAPRSSSQASSFNVPVIIPREGINYVIRWGDTLWNIAETFYRDPWRYPVIAQYNSISNPAYIISGRTIRIPQR